MATSDISEEILDDSNIPWYAAEKNTYFFYL